MQTILFNGSVNTEALECVLSYIAPEDLPLLRLVSKACNELLIRPGSQLLAHFAYVVHDDESKEILLASKTPWESIRFFHYIMEPTFLGIEEKFLTFRKKFGTCLKNLAFQECILGMGRFIELIAFCTNLEAVIIYRCPSLFHSGFEVINWYQFVPRFRASLMKLESFILDEEYHLQDVSLYTLTSEMNKLKQLVVSSETVRLPLTAIEKTMGNCAQTLETVRISGSEICNTKKHDYRWARTLEIENSSLIEFWNNLKVHKFPKLTSLHLCRLPIWQGFEFSQFLNQCEHLDNLNVTKMVLPSDVFANCRRLRYTLKTLRIADCLLEHRTLAHLVPYENLNTIIFLREPALGEDINDMSYATMAPLFNSVRPKCSRLVYRCKIGAEFACLIGHNFPNLESLEFLYVENIRTRQLMSLRFLKNLKSLSLRGCELMDGTFFPGEEEKVSDQLFPLFKDGLQGLQLLDLACTSIGDETVQKWITHLGNLIVLDLSDTLVSTEGLSMLLSSIQLKRQPHLRNIFLEGCVHCKLSKNHYSHVESKFPDVFVKLDVVSDEKNCPFPKPL